MSHERTASDCSFVDYLILVPTVADIGFGAYWLFCKALRKAERALEQIAKQLRRAKDDPHGDDVVG